MCWYTSCCRDALLAITQDESDKRTVLGAVEESMKWVEENQVSAHTKCNATKHALLKLLLRVKVRCVTSDE